MQSALPHAAPPAPAAGGGGQEREGVWGAANGSWGWGGTPGPAGTRTQGLWGHLTRPSLRVALESTGVSVTFPCSRGLGQCPAVTLPVVNCLSQRRTSRLSSSLGKEWERGRRSGLAEQGLGSSCTLVVHPRGDQGPERSEPLTFLPSWWGGVLTTACWLLRIKKV